jgi:predicted PurR-regulated permease PerM
MPAWFLVAPACGFLNVVPRFGALAALALGIAAAALGGLELARVAGVLGVCLAAFTIEGYWLTPRILGRRLGLRPLYVFLAVLVGGALFGFLGLLLAVPALAVAMAVYRFFAAPRV